MTADQIAQMADRAETELLKAMTSEMRNWYLRLPRERRVQIAQNAFVNAINEIRA
jgi:hypothetical protein